MSYREVFKMPKPVKITGRTSSITNAFVNGIIPVIEPTEAEIKEALSILGMDESTICCAYCGAPYTEWDHLRPLIIGKTATGYVSEIHNLVPACGKCNQSKGNQNWREWMFGTAKLSPATRNVPDINKRSERLEKFEAWGTPLKIDIEALVGKYKWSQHWENCEKIKALMYESQTLSDEIREILQKALNTNNQEIAKCFYDRVVPDEKKNGKIKNGRMVQERAVGKIVQQDLIQLLLSGKVPEQVIEYLQDKDYSKQKFNVNYAVLLHIESLDDVKKGVDHSGVNRYYAKPISIKNQLYLVTSQWYDRNRERLLRWMAKYNEQ